MSIPVFLSSDNNYAPFVASTIASICDNTKDFINFYILDGGISSDNKIKIEKLKDSFKNFSIEFISIDVDDKFKDFVDTSVITKSMYNRFLIADLKPEISKAIYLDVDLISLSDISELWAQNLESKAIGWCLDTGVSNELDDIFKKFNITNYFNSGVLLIDLDLWRKYDYTNKLFDLEKKIRSDLKLPDQDLLNIVFADDCKQLDSKFNVQYGSENIVIRHFVNVFKPWKSNYFKVGNGIKPLENFENFWHYVNMTEFKEELTNIYNESINSNMLTKRMSIIADKMKKEIKND